MKVALITEGTYPLHPGGVAAWCDQLVRGLPEVRFEVVALSGSGREPVAFTPPGNVAAVRRVGLWARVPRGKPFTGRTTERFVGAYAQMFESVLRGGPRAAEWFETSLRTLRELSRRGSLTGALRSQLAVDVLLDVWSRTPVPGAPADVTMTLADALVVTDLVEHFLRPLQLPPPKAQLVHATANGPSMLVGLTAKWATGTPVLLSEHGVYLRERLLAVRRDGYPRTVRTVLVRFFHRLCELGYRGADVVLPVSDFNGRWAVRGGAPADRVRTLHNGVDPRELPLLEDEPAVPTLVFAGRIDPLKDLDTLVRAFALVREQVPDARLRLFGGVPAGNEAYAQEIRRLVADLALEGSATFEGPVSPVSQAFAAGHVVVQSSLSEGLPLTVIEAAISGRPTVVTDVGGMPEAAGRGGVVVPPGDPAAFAAVCVRLLTEHDTRRALAADGREDALARFTLTRFLDDVRSVYTDFAPPKKRSPWRGRRTTVGAPGSDPAARAAAAGGTDRAERGGAVNENAQAVLAHAVSSSVDPLEAAVVLESRGVNDRLARDLFGAADVVALTQREIRAAGPDRATSEPDAAPPPPAALAAPPRTRWLALRGILYAVPALVALALVPAVDPVESALVLGGLVVSWAWSYGVASVAWAYLGDRDPAGARRFLRRSLLVGVFLAVVVATVAVYAALILTSTMQVTLATVALLAGQSAYLMAAAVLLMTGRELLLLAALAPAVAALGLGLAGRPVAVSTGIGPLHWIGGSVALATVFALFATRGAARPVQRLGATAWSRGLQQFAFGLLVALVVLFPAVNELVNENYDALPLSVTLAALPLVLAMGVAEGLLYRYRARMHDLLGGTASPAVFSQAARRALAGHQLVFAATLVALSGAVGGVVAALSGAVDRRYVLLALDYAVLGPALFAAMLLSLLGRADRVLETLGAGAVALAAFELHAATQAATDTEALIWFGIVGAVLLVVHLMLVRRCVTVPVHHR